MVSGLNLYHHGCHQTQIMTLSRRFLLLSTLLAASITVALSEAAPGNDVTDLTRDQHSISTERQRRSFDDDSSSEVWFEEPMNKDKRARYFLGKRPNRYFLGKRSQSDEEMEKRGKYFLGKRGDDDYDKRARYFLGKRSDDENSQESSDEKRARYFLGKRPRYFLGKRSDDRSDEEMENLLKRARYFLGKRARYFLGKRSYYERDSEPIDSFNPPQDKRGRYFLGK